MEIKVATEHDITSIEKLYEQLFANMAALQPQYWQNASPSISYIKTILKSKTGDFLVAVKDSQVIGFALVQEQETSPYNCIIYRKFANLMDIVVDKAFQGHGVGTALLTTVKWWAKNRDLEYIELQVLAENTGAIKLYEKFNYRTVKQTMRAPLKPTLTSPLIEPTTKVLE